MDYTLSAIFCDVNLIIMHIVCKHLLVMEIDDSNDYRHIMYLELELEWHHLNYEIWVSSCNFTMSLYISVNNVFQLILRILIYLAVTQPGLYFFLHPSSGEQISSISFPFNRHE